MKYAKLSGILAVALGLLLVASVAVLAAEGEEKPAAEEKPKATLDQRLTNLYQALVKYSATHRRMTPLGIEKLVEYLPEGKEGLINPDTGKPLEMNPKMRSVFEMTIKKPAEFVAFYAEAETAGKGRATMFCDGKIQYLGKKAFTEALEKSTPKKLSDEERDALRFPDKRGR